MANLQRRALVTGASSGIGEATARVLAKEGYTLALLARNVDRLRDIASELPGHGHFILECDLCDNEQIEAAFALLRETWDGLDLLVNNAGIGYRALVSELDDALLERLFRTNVIALLHTSRLALPLLKRGSKPVLINVSSVVGRRGIPGQVAYSASKAAVCSISEGLRIEWAKEGIAVCTLNPALTTTGFFEAQANPQGLPSPSLESASGPDQVAHEILQLDRSPRPERSLRWKWRVLSALSVLAPRLCDKLLVRNLGDNWAVPKR
ncbi:MAG: short-subunit dehydrogenase [Planctomycetota bacterium]